MLLRVFATAIAAIVTFTATPTVEAHHHVESYASAPVMASGPDDTVPTGDTVNVFFPEQRSLGDCLSSLPKPGCGSAARGGWRQTLVLVAILAGLAFIASRIVIQSRKARS